MKSGSKRILVIYYSPEPLEKTRMTILHHLRALEYSENGYDIVYENVYPVYLSFMTGQKRAGMSPRYASTEFDAVILHYSFLSIRTIGWSFRDLRSEFD